MAVTLAINLIKRRLKDAFGGNVQFAEQGQPTAPEAPTPNVHPTTDEARALEALRQQEAKVTAGPSERDSKAQAKARKLQARKEAEALKAQAEADRLTREREARKAAQEKVDAEKAAKAQAAAEHLRAAQDARKPADQKAAEEKLRAQEQRQAAAAAVAGTRVGNGGVAPPGTQLTREQKLADLLRRYQADEIGPVEYHTERAKILAEP